MDKIERIGISVEKKLLKDFDKVIKKKTYPSRSEAFRDMIRETVNEEKLSDPDSFAIASLNIVYDHHTTELAKKITSLQHTHVPEVVCSTHIHITSTDCMESIILKGKVKDSQKLSERIISQKGVKVGKVNFISLQNKG